MLESPTLPGTPTPADIDAFIQRWIRSSAAETANFQSFIHDLCDLLDVPRPDPTTKKVAANDANVFERSVEFRRKGQREGAGPLNQPDPIPLRYSEP